MQYPSTSWDNYGAVRVPAKGLTSALCKGDINSVWKLMASTLYAARGRDEGKASNVNRGSAYERRETPPRNATLSTYAIVSGAAVSRKLPDVACAGGSAMAVGGVPAVADVSRPRRSAGQSQVRYTDRSSLGLILGLALTTMALRANRRPELTSRTTQRLQQCR